MVAGIVYRRSNSMRKLIVKTNDSFDILGNGIN